MCTKVLDCRVLGVSVYLQKEIVPFSPLKCEVWSIKTRRVE